jgi:hypothetical protein
MCSDGNLQLRQNNNNNNNSVQFSVLMCLHKGHKASDKDSIRTYEKYTNNK